MKTKPAEWFPYSQWRHSGGDVINVSTFSFLFPYLFFLPSFYSFFFLPFILLPRSACLLPFILSPSSFPDVNC
jgi:hypothetical protein